MDLGIVFLVATAAAACPPLEEGVETAVKALLDGADPAAGFAAAEASLACGPARPGPLAALWLARGAALQLAGDEPAARPFYASARALAPDQFDERLGAAVRASWEAASASGPGRLLANRPVKVDDQRVSRFPAPTASGPHAVQAPDAGWARVVVVQAGEDLQVAVPAAAPETSKKKSPLAGVLGGVALAGAIGAGLGAISQTEVMAAAPTTSSLDEAWGTQQALGYTSIGLAALGATGITLQIALP